jgi:hypothetical protein
MLPDDVQPAERGQVRTIKGSVSHVEVRQMGRVRTSILGRPRRLASHRLAGPSAERRYTLI